MTLRTFIIRRLIIVIPTFFFITLLVFTLIHIAPGDPALAMVGRHPALQDVMEQIRKELGLDRPLHEQYLIWVSRLIQGDFGRSYVSGRPVWDMITTRVPRTLELMLAAEFVSILLAIVLGVIAAVKHYSLIDSVCSAGALIGYSLPSFWIGIMAIIVFAFYLGWFPMPRGVILETPYDHVRYLALPTSILVLGWTAYLFRMVRSSMLEVLRQDYITTARAKGLRERIVIYKHALRNGLLPVMTYLGYSVGFLLSGAAVIEYVFAWPGLGSLMVEMASVRDYTTLMGVGVMIAVMVLVANLCADIAYAVVDPRIRYD